MELLPTGAWRCSPRFSQLEEVSDLFLRTDPGKCSSPISKSAKVSSESVAMSAPEVQVHNTRRLARIFTPSTPRHHPLLDPNLPEENVSLVPSDLKPRGNLNWELPKNARTNLHIMLKLSNKADELLDEFYAKIPMIDEVLSEWAEMRGASPTIEGLEKLRAQITSDVSVRNNEAIHQNGNDDYVFNMVRNLETPGRADVIYLTDAVEDDSENAQTSNGKLPNVRSTEWLDFDGSYVHVQDADDSADNACAMPEALNISKKEKRNSVPPNLRISDWETDQEAYLTPSVYSAKAASDNEGALKQVGPFEEFWRTHEVPFGAQVVLRSDDEGEVMSSCDTPRTVPDLEIPSPLKSPQNQDPARLMVPEYQSEQWI